MAGPDADQLTLSFDAGPPAEVRPTVEIRPSTRRRKTVGAHWEGDTIVVVVPQRMSKRLRQEYADDLVERLLRDRRTTHPTDAELAARAARLAAEHLPEVEPPAAVTWSQERSRWGSCTLTDRTIRISDSLRGAPSWVVDAILVHELAHLLRPNHDAGFKALVARYPRTAEAEAFLEGYQFGLSRP